MAPSEFAEMMASSAVSASARKVASAARRLPGLAGGGGDSRSVFDPDRESCGRTHVKDLISYLPVYAFVPSKRVSYARPALRVLSLCRAAPCFPRSWVRFHQASVPGKRNHPGNRKNHFG